MILILFSFIIWTIFWSFISVLIRRIKTQEKWIFIWRSKCPYCNHTLNAVDLVPIFSYMFLKWKCRYCHKKISIVYPFLEITTWLIFIFVVYLILKAFDLNMFLNNMLYVIYWWILAILIIALSFYDILFYEIDFKLAWILWIMLLLPQIFWVIWNFQTAILLAIIWFLIFIWISFARIKIRKIEWLWWWDAIWAWLLWLLMPILHDLLWWNLPIWIEFYVLIMLWFAIAAFIWVIWLSSKKLKMLSKIPFLPFMFWSIILFVFIWNSIINFILH